MSCMIAAKAKNITIKYKALAVPPFLKNIIADLVIVKIKTLIIRGGIILIFHS